MTLIQVGSILAGVIMLVGPIASILVNKFGPRITCIAGAIISGLAIFISTFSVNVYMMMVFYGVLAGLGLGFIYVPAITEVGYWFEKKRSLVTGISTSGSGFGTIVFPPVLTALESSLGWRWCLRIVASFCLSCTLLGATMKPVPYIVNKEKDVMLVKDTEVAVVTKENRYLVILKNIPFLTLLLANLPAIMAMYIPYTFLPGITQQKGLSEANSAILISLIGVFNTVGRVIAGAVTDHPNVDALFLTAVTLLTGAVCPALMTLCLDFWSFAVVCIMFGLLLSVMPAVTSPCLVDILGLDYLTSAFGVLTCIRGVSALLGPPLGGFVIDATSPEELEKNEEDTSNYEVAFYISASLLCAASIGHLISFAVKKASQKNKI